MRQNESTEKAEKLMTPSEGQDQIEPHMGIYTNMIFILQTSKTEKVDTIDKESLRMQENPNSLVISQDKLSGIVLSNHVI